MHRIDSDAAPRSCDGCALGRREFVKGATLAAMAVGVTGTRLAALPMRAIEALAVQGGTLTYPVPASDSVNIDRKNDTMVARVGSKVFVFARTCPHQNTALRWNGGDKQFQCPKHGSKYTAEGTFIEGRATRSLDRFAVRKDGATVVVDLDRLYQQDTDADLWQAAFITA